MNKKNSRLMLYGIIGAAFIAMALLAYPSNDNASELRTYAPVTALSSDEPMHDFGKISMAKGNVTHAFSIINESDEAVTIQKMYTSCMCTTAILISGTRTAGPFGMPGHGVIPRINEVIEPRGAAIIEITFDPAAHGPAGIGRVQRAVYVENDSGKPLELSFSAMVTP